MPRHLAAFAVSCFLLASPPLPQYPVPPQNRHERVICIVPMIGAGTRADPKRPLFAPAPADIASSGIISFSYQLSDDGKFALVEFVALDRARFANILNDRRPDIKVFVKGESSRADIEREFRKHKPNFDAGDFARGR